MKDDLCYFPTRRLCSLNDRLEDNFFPDDLVNVFKQEIKTYTRIKGGIKINTHTRDFIGGQHYDCRQTQIMLGEKNDE
jgi:hypothetical protein